jgi:cell division protein FtsB
MSHPPSFNRNRSKRKIFFLLALFVMGFFSLVTTLGDEGLLKLRNLYKLRDRVRHENQELFETNRKLIREATLLKEPSFTEQLIRKKLGYIKPREYVLILGENMNTESGPSPTALP